jgi:hypothetical protein
MWLLLLPLCLALTHSLMAGSWQLHVPAARGQEAAAEAADGAGLVGDKPALLHLHINALVTLDLSCGGRICSAQFELVRSQQF